MRVRHSARILSLSLAGLLLASTLTGCATNPATGRPYMSFPFGVGRTIESGFTSIYDSPNPCSNNDRNIGITAGVIFGALIAHEIGSNKVGDVIGAAIGGGIGGLIGHAVDARRCKLYKIAKKNGMRLVSASITPAKMGNTAASKAAKRAIGLDVEIQDHGQSGDEFYPGTATLTPAARVGFAAVAQQYVPATLEAGAGKHVTPQMRAQVVRRKVLIVGHTDEPRSRAQGARLSFERARAVALVFAHAGVPVDDIYYQGAGDTLPIASNATAKGREENRRVQIVDVPSTADLREYVQDRTADPADFSVGKVAPPGHSARPSMPPAAPVPTPVVAVRPPARRARGTMAAVYRFGGSPVPSQPQYIDLGVPVSNSMFSFIRSAQAAAPVLIRRSCVADRPRDATVIRNLGTGKDLPINRALPGFYGAPWVGMVHGNLVAILHPYVPASVDAPVPSPEIDIYRDYAALHESAPTFSRYAPVDVYRGSKAVVYRVFVHGPVGCLDLIDPIKDAVGVGDLYYGDNGTEYIARSAFRLRQ